jgi:hypothetical protein
VLCMAGFFLTVFSAQSANALTFTFSNIADRYSGDYIAVGSNFMLALLETVNGRATYGNAVAVGSTVNVSFTKNTEHATVAFQMTINTSNWQGTYNCNVFWSDGSAPQYFTGTVTLGFGHAPESSESSVSGVLTGE